VPCKGERTNRECDSRARTERRQRAAPVIRRRRASILLVLDRLDRPAAFYVQAEDLAHQQTLEPAARAAFEALAAALEAAA